MTVENLGHEYEFEPQYGLPERLPADEHIVWQGSPDVRALAASAFHTRKLVFYFGLLGASLCMARAGVRRRPYGAAALGQVDCSAVPHRPALRLDTGLDDSAHHRLYGYE